MAGNIEEIREDDDGIAPEVETDPEKMPTRVTEGRFSEQIPHEMLEELAPNGEGEYLLDKINGLTEDEALDIVREGR